MRKARWYCSWSHTRTSQRTRTWTMAMNPTPVREAPVHWSTRCRFAMTLPTFLLMLLPSPIPDEETGLEIHKISRPPGFSAERRRSRAVLYQLSGHLQKQDKSKSKLKINNVRLVSSFFAPSPLPHSAPHSTDFGFQPFIFSKAWL